MERLRKNVSATNQRPTVEVLLRRCFLFGLRRGYNNENPKPAEENWKIWQRVRWDSEIGIEWIDTEFWTGGCDQRTWEREAEESPLLEAVARVRLVKTQQAGKGLACAVVNCEVWRLEIALWLLSVPSGVHKWSINPISNPYPVYSHAPKYVWEHRIYTPQYYRWNTLNVPIITYVIMV
jgi:hypothetical protein